MKPVKILIVDDDPGQRSLLESFLRSQGFQTVTASSGERALEWLGTDDFNLMISDVRMPGLSGLETLRRARRLHPHLPVLLVTAFADVRDAVGAMRDGAINYLSKPIDLDELAQTVRYATGLVPEDSIRLADNLTLPPQVIAESPGMRRVFRDAALVARSESRILITGESGVGKEVLADVIHQWSTHAAGPCVKVNCAAIPETLLESELFGHERGAFTGATAARAGRFEQAGAGTIFLDEIAEMSPQLQAKLLRVTQDGSFQRIGSGTERRVQARLLAATHRHLEEEVRAGRFREDLYYRLNVVELHVPPLRERPEDILPLAARFMGEFTGGRARFSQAVLETLGRYAWPGNVRELRNAMERAALLSHGELVLPEHLPARIVSGGPATATGAPGSREGGVPAGPSGAEAGRLDDVERQTILRVLRENRYNRTETARVLGISRRTLLYKLQHLRSLGETVDAEADPN